MHESFPDNLIILFVIVAFFMFVPDMVKSVKVELKRELQWRQIIKKEVKK